MKLFIASVFIAVASAARLDNNYLPPGSAKTAGGSGNFLGAPFGGSKFAGAANSPVPQYGAPAGHRSAEAGAAILRYNNANNGDGSYQFEYETQNKISQNEAGHLKNQGSDNEAEEVHGSYSYISPEGQTITVNYIANEYGFQPSGDHLPTSPPIPEAILKSLQQIQAAAGSNGFSGDNSGQYQSTNVNRQYIAPNAPSFNSQSGYRY